MNTQLGLQHCIQLNTTTTRTTTTKTVEHKLIYFIKYFAVKKKKNLKCSA